MNSKSANIEASTTIGIALALRHLRKRAILGYAIAILIIGSATLMQWQLRGHYAGAPFLIIYPAIILATFAGGLGPGLLAAILAGASQFGLFIPNFHWVAIGSYSFDAAICVALIVLINRTMDTLCTNDVLTGSANRTFFSEQLERVLQQISRGERIAILYLDLDDLQRVNETLGHPVGDKLLRAVANRLRGCVRDSDFVARLDGDQFAVIQTQLEHPSDAAELAARAREAIHEPFRLDGQEVKVTVSVGIAVAPDDAGTVNELLKAADVALFEAKSTGRGHCCFYRAEMNEKMRRRSKLEHELQNALANGEFELFYQPILNFREGRIKAFEALLRWRHPERGMISPPEFIPITEKTGLIVPLGEWVLRSACAEAGNWNRGFDVAVNVSAIQLASGSFTDVVAGALSSAALQSNRLFIEITESIFLEHKSSNLETLESIRKLGVRFAMDDLGSGYSSLTYLLSFPFDKIKIDQRFIAGLPGRRESRAIVRALADLARELNIRAVAEGVETVAQMEEARALGCTDVQGHFISVPLPADQVQDFIRTYEIKSVSLRNMVA